MFTDSNEEGRFRHVFVDALHQSYLDSLFPPIFRKSANDVVGFIGKE